MFKNAFANFPWKELATRLISDTPFLIPCDGSQCLWLIFYFQVKQYPDVPNLLCWNIYPCQQDSEIYTPATKISSPLYYSIYAVYMQYIYHVSHMMSFIIYIFDLQSVFVHYTYASWNLFFPALASTRSCQCYFFSTAQNVAPSHRLLTLA